MITNEQVLNAFHGVIHPEMYDAELFKPIAKKLVERVPALKTPPVFPGK